MQVTNVIHKGLHRLIEEDDIAGVPSVIAAKLRRMVSFLQDMEREEELRAVPRCNAHRLRGDRKGTWSLSVTANWRITFRIDREEMEIIDLNYEDYH